MLLRGVIAILSLRGWVDGYTGYTVVDSRARLV